MDVEMKRVKVEVEWWPSFFWCVDMAVGVRGGRGWSVELVNENKHKVWC